MATCALSGVDGGLRGLQGGRVLVRSTTDWLYCSSAWSSWFCSSEIWLSNLATWASVALIWPCGADVAEPWTEPADGDEVDELDGVEEVEAGETEDPAAEAPAVPVPKARPRSPTEHRATSAQTGTGVPMPVRHRPGAL